MSEKLQPMRLHEWADHMGLTYQTAWRLYKRGKIPYKTSKVSERITLVWMPITDSSQVALYARVSSADHKQDLERQIARLSVYAVANGLNVKTVVSEVGSGMNENRDMINKLLKDPEVTKIVVEHKDRLGRMNVELVRSALQANGRDIIVVDETELDDDLVSDMIDVLTSFCARLYGKDGARNKAQRALECIDV